MFFINVVNIKNDWYNWIEAINTMNATSTKFMKLFKPLNALNIVNIRIKSKKYQTETVKPVSIHIYCKNTISYKRQKTEDLTINQNKPTCKFNIAYIESVCILK